MANPIVYACPQETWTPIAINKTVGEIYILEPLRAYYLTYRVTGAAVPLDSYISESPRVTSNIIDIESETGIDVYIWTIKDASGEDGKVTVYT